MSKKRLFFTLLYAPWRTASYLGSDATAVANDPCGTCSSEGEVCSGAWSTGSGGGVVGHGWMSDSGGGVVGHGWMSESGENWEFSMMLDSGEVLTVGEGVYSLSGDVSAGVSTSSTVC